VRATDDVVVEGRVCVRVETPQATYLYDKAGGGLARLLDRDGRDWITWRYGDGPAGEFRGIPNLGACCHPGYPDVALGKVDTETWLPGPGGGATVALRTRSLARDEAGPLYDLTWTFFPTHATLTVHRARGPYWFLYEGTPGGAWDPADGYVIPPGTKRPATERWTGELSPEWIYFTASERPRALFLLHHEDDDLPDSYWPMREAMTVFGFGRDGKPFLERSPQHLSVGLVDSDDPNAVRAAIERAARATPSTRQPL
jgi:hypothetical protein